VCCGQLQYLDDTAIACDYLHNTCSQDVDGKCNVRACAAAAPAELVMPCSVCVASRFVIPPIKWASPVPSALVAIPAACHALISLLYQASSVRLLWWAALYRDGADDVLTKDQGTKEAEQAQSAWRCDLAAVAAAVG
jgi:hypothetical protein